MSLATSPQPNRPSSCTLWEVHLYSLQRDAAKVHVGRNNHRALRRMLCSSGAMRYAYCTLHDLMPR